MRGCVKGAGLNPTGTLTVLNPPSENYPVGCSMMYVNDGSGGGSWKDNPIWNPYVADDLSGGDGCLVPDSLGGHCAIPCKDRMGSQQQSFNDVEINDMECSPAGNVALDGDNSDVGAAMCAQRCYVMDQCNYFTVSGTAPALLETADRQGGAQPSALLETADETADEAADKQAAADAAAQAQAAEARVAATRRRTPLTGLCKGFSTCDETDRVACTAADCFTRTV